MKDAYNRFPKALRKICLAAAVLGAFAAPASTAAQDASLEQVLLKAADYCKKLEASIFDFICREEVRENIHPVPPPAQSSSGEIAGLRLSNRMPVWMREKKTYVYDYQCTRKDGRLQESRILLEDNGRKTNEAGAALKTTGVDFHNALLNPINLFAARNQGNYEFRFAGRDRQEGRPVILVEAERRPGTGAADFLAVKAWLAETGGDILKIEWIQVPHANLRVFREREGFFNGTLRLRVRTEFRAEKNGLRFPSRLWIEEAYVRTGGKAHVRSELNVAYKDFKFFNVDYDVR